MGNKLDRPVESIVRRRCDDTMVKVGFAEMNGWRMSMEDAHVIHLSDTWGFFGVFDGHGGAECSKFIAQRIQEELGKLDGPPADDAAMQALALRLDQEYLDKDMEGGSTATFVIIERSREISSKFSLRVGNIGDSRVLLGDLKDGCIREGAGTDGALTTDHKPDHPDERVRIERCGGIVLDSQRPARVQRPSSRSGDLSVSRAFGDRAFKPNADSSQEEQIVIAVPEFQKIECDSSSFIMLVCDGISEGTFPNAEVVSLAAEQLKANSDPMRAATVVCQRAFAEGSMDNLSCMIVVLGGGSVRTDVIDFMPGPFVLPKSRVFRRAYQDIASRASLTLEEAVERRYDAVGNYLDVRETNDETTAALRKELEDFNGGPPLAVDRDSRLQWFRTWLEVNLPSDTESEGVSFREPATTSLMEGELPLPVCGFASTLFLMFAACHWVCLVLHIVVNRLNSLGRFFLTLVIVGLTYDKTLVATGGWFFPQALFHRDHKRHLIRLSYPRILTHVVLMPLLSFVAVEVGDEGDVAFVHKVFGVFVDLLFILISLVGFCYFIRFQRLQLKRPPSSMPTDALPSQLLRCTLAAVQSRERELEREHLRYGKMGAIAVMTVPVASVCLLAILVGVSCIVDAPSDDSRGIYLVLGAFVELATGSGFLEHFPDLVSYGSWRVSWTLELVANIGEVLFVFAFVKSFGGPH